MAVALKRRHFTVDEYHRMAEAGILTEDDRVELIDGEIVEMSPIGSPHAGQVTHLTALLVASFAGKAVVSVQNPVRLSPRSEPQPDLAILRPRADSYRRAHPTPADVFVLIEVTDTSSETDRRVKVPLYGRHGIVETWLVDVNAERLEVYRDPAADGYRDVRVLRRGEALTIEALPDVTLTVSDLLGPEAA